MPEPIYYGQPVPNTQPPALRLTDDGVTYVIQQGPAMPPAVVPQQLPTAYQQVPPGAQLIPGPDGQPAFFFPQQPERGPLVHPLLANAAVAVALLLGVGAGCWMLASFLTALAALIKLLVMGIAVLVGGTIALKILGAGGGRVRVDVEASSGRGRRAARSRVRVRR